MRREHIVVAVGNRAGSSIDHHLVDPVDLVDIAAVGPVVVDTVVVGIGVVADLRIGANIGHRKRRRRSHL
jgi:hypothetical protein